jgi:hypothetical protein
MHMQTPRWIVMALMANILAAAKNVELPPESRFVGTMRDDGNWTCGGLTINAGEVRAQCPDAGEELLLVVGDDARIVNNSQRVGVAVAEVSLHEEIAAPFELQRLGACVCPSSALPCRARIT